MRHLGAGSIRVTPTDDMLFDVTSSASDPPGTVFLSRTLAGLLAAAVVALVSGCTGPGSDDPSALVGPSTTVSAPEGVVIIKGIAYNPATLSVVPGHEVVWRFEDNGVKHTVTADDGSFTSGRRTEGEFRHMFGQPGEYAYRCEVHSRMKGKVVVLP